VDSACKCGKVYGTAREGDGEFFIQMYDMTHSYYMAVWSTAQQESDTLKFLFECECASLFVFVCVCVRESVAWSSAQQESATVRYSFKCML